MGWLQELVSVERDGYFAMYPEHAVFAAIYVGSRIRFLAKPSSMPDPASPSFVKQDQVAGTSMLSVNSESRDVGRPGATPRGLGSRNRAGTQCSDFNGHKGPDSA